MKKSKIETLGTALLFVSLLLSVAAPPSSAATFTPGDEDENDSNCDPSSDDHCSGNTRTGPNGDPEDCPVTEETTAGGHAACIEATAQGNGYGATLNQELTQTVTFSGNQGSNFEVPPDPVEVDSYCVREDSDFIQSAQIQVDKPNLVAKISNFTEKPSPHGWITIRVNRVRDADGNFPLTGNEIQIDASSAASDVGRLNKLVCGALDLEGLDVDCLRRFFVIRADSVGESPRSVALVVDDPHLETMELALEPSASYHDITACSPDIGPAPVTLQR